MVNFGRKLDKYYRFIMMHEGCIIYSVGGEGKKKLIIDDLLEKFANLSVARNFQMTERY